MGTLLLLCEFVEQLNKWVWLEFISGIAALKCGDYQWSVIRFNYTYVVIMGTSLLLSRKIKQVSVLWLSLSVE